MARIKFNHKEFAELRTSAAAEAMVDKEAEAMAARANTVPSTADPAATEPYYEVEDASDGTRARKRVRTTGRRAARHEAKTQALQRSL